MQSSVVHNLLRSPRAFFTAGFMLCLVALMTALYFQFVMGLEPCPLCIFQRVFMLGVGLLFLVAAVHNPHGFGRRIYGGLVALMAGLGAGVAGRHVWLQSLPADQVPECGVDLDYMLQAFPITKTIRLVLRGSGDCAEVMWTFLGLSIPGWTLIMFSGLTLFGLLLVFGLLAGKR
ncbi:MAG: disulfide bond formation protein B [Gammaproteobacteria bacterium]|jgi:disulfide bond formation protein DsbB|nr:disulfide bond formation protein B [Gammaproteobacteria bacterium]